MKTAILYNPQLEKYSFGEGHPFGGDRFIAFFDFFGSAFAPFKDRFEIITPPIADEETIKLVHTEEYIQTIRAASNGKPAGNIFEYISLDNVNPVTGYIPPGIEEASRVIVGSSLAAAERVAKGKCRQAIAFGGAHHAKTAFGEGFCFYNDVAICARYLQKKYKLERILILDTDAHAGNGTKVIFYDDPGVLFVDIHQDPHTIYPGTGFIKEKGEGKGEGFTVNIPVPPRTGNDAYKYIFDEIIHPLAREFKPQAIIRNGGSDPHYMDSLTSLGLNLKGFTMIGEEVRKMAQELTDGRVIDLILSGYNLKVLPFAWSALIAGLMDIKVDLSALEEKNPPDPSGNLNDVKEIVREIKKTFGKYWRCMAQ